MTVLVTPKWFFVAVLTQPYTRAPTGFPVYLDGFDFAGLLSLQTAEKTWPATAGLEDQTISVVEAFTKSTKETRIGADEDDMDTQSSMIKIEHSM